MRRHHRANLALGRTGPHMHAPGSRFNINAIIFIIITTITVLITSM